MTKLPVVSGRECVRVLTKVGFYFSHQKGSHIIMRRDEPYAKTVVPDHRELKKGTFRQILRDAELTVDEFVALL